MTLLKSERKTKLKECLKILKKYAEAKTMSPAECMETMEAFKMWMKDEKTESSFVKVTKTFYNWIEKVEMTNKAMKGKFSETVLSTIEDPEILTDLDKQRVMKRLLVLAVSKLSAETLLAFWSSSLRLRKAVISSEILSEWIMDWARKGNTADKQAWERFITSFVPSSTHTTITTAQNCHVSWKATIEKPEKKEVETMVVWNGNGMRARWTGKSELKELVRASDPDVLCFLEGKTDIDHLLQLEDFEQWIKEVGYKHLYCYWSRKRFWDQFIWERRNCCFSVK